MRFLASFAFFLLPSCIGIGIGIEHNDRARIEMPRIDREGTVESAPEQPALSSIEV